MSILCISIVVTTSVLGQVINFEALPNGAPTIDGQQISSEYSSFGLSFRLLNHTTGQFAGYPRIAKTGSPGTAFQGCPGDDIPLWGQGVGSSFLTDDGVIGTTYDVEVSYFNPIQNAAGVLLDVDGAEQWTLTARDSGNNIVAQSVISAPIGPNNPECPGNNGGPGDGRAIGWSLTTATPLISTVVFRYTGSSSAVGFALDNFSPSSLAPPLSVAILASPWNRLCHGETTTLQCDASGGAPPYSFRFEAETSSGNWSQAGISTSQTVQPSRTTRYRYGVTDSQATQAVSNVMEIGVCPQPSDVNGDGEVNGLDIQLFVDALLG